MALGAVVDSSLLLLLPLCGLALVVGGLLAGQVAGAARLLATAVGGTVVAVVLHLPWSLSFVDGWSALVAPTSTAGQAMDLASVLRFDTGPLGSGVAGLFLLVAAALPLLIGRRWRLGWAVRSWAVAVTGFALVWVEGQGWLSVDLPAPEVFLAPAAVGLAVATALGMVAFEVDLPDYHFGWRQIVSLLAGAAFVIAVVPAWSGVVSGRWELPRGDFARSLAFMREEAAAEPMRALWLGDAGVLPGVGWALDAPGIDDLGDDRVLTYLTSERGVPTVSEHWPGAEGAATPARGRCRQGRSVRWHVQAGGAAGPDGRALRGGAARPRPRPLRREPSLRSRRPPGHPGGAARPGRRDGQPGGARVPQRGVGPGSCAAARRNDAGGPRWGLAHPSGAGRRPGGPPGR